MPMIIPKSETEEEKLYNSIMRVMTNNMQKISKTIDDNKIKPVKKQ